ncbi:MAG: ion channel [Leptolyngbyaceae cyanobacterium]
MFLFGILHFLIPDTISRDSFWECFYFSIATFTTLGSGISVTSFMGELLTSAEVVIGYLMTGLLVAILVRNTIGN